MAQLNDELMINGNNVYQVYGYKSVLITSDEKRIFGMRKGVFGARSTRSIKN